MAFLGVGVRFKNCFGSTQIAEQLLFYMFHSILTLNFDLVLGLFLFFRSKWTIFKVRAGRKTIWGLLIHTKNFCFTLITYSKLYLTLPGG